MKRLLSVLTVLCVAAWPAASGILPLMGVGPSSPAPAGPPPSCVLGGAIGNNVTVNVNGLNYTSQNAGTTHSLRAWSCNSGYRFETRSGEHWSGDASDVQHNELSGTTTYARGTGFWCSWSKRTCNGSTGNCATGLLPAALYHTSPQGHHNGNTGNPPWSINYTQSLDLNVMQRASTGGASGTATVAYDGVVNQWVDGTWHNFVVHLLFNNSSTSPNTGIHEFWQDGFKRVDKCPGCAGGTTNIGYSAADHTVTYMKWGDYHGNSSGTVLVDYANWTCSTSSLLSKVTSPDPVDIP